MIIALSSTALGCASAFRILSLALRNRNAPRAQLTKIGTVASLASLACVALFARDGTQAWAASAIAPCAALAHLAIARARRETRFRSDLYGFLCVLVLRMKSGESLRAALDGAIDDADEDARPRLRELRDVVVFSQQASTFTGDSARRASGSLARAARELALADRDAHSAIRRCSALRDRVRIEDEFRRKSGQASRQARAQSIVLAGLYLATFAFVGAQFGVAKHARALALSGAMFVAGLAWTQLVGRKIKWKT